MDATRKASPQVERPPTRAPTLAGQAAADTARSQARGDISSGADVEALFAAQAARDETPAGHTTLSPAQERLWFLDKLVSGSGVHNLSTALRVQGPLDVQGLQRSLAVLVERYEVLRTVWESVDGQPRPTVKSGATPELPLVDLSASPGVHVESEALRLCHQEAARPFDLGVNLMLRARLLRLGAQDHVLCLTAHRMAADPESMATLIEELALIYSAFATGALPPPPRPLASFAEFAARQRMWLRSDARREQEAYWRKQLAGAPDLLPLPTDHRRPTVQGTRGAVSVLALPPALSVALASLAQRAEAPLFAVLLAAFQALLARYSDQEDLNVGTPFTPPGADSCAIGPRANLLVMRGDLAGDPTFLELLRRTCDVWRAAQAHGDLPFEVLVETLQTLRVTSRAPLFQVQFALCEPPVPAPWAGLKAASVFVHGGCSRFDLSLTMSLERGALGGVLEYNADLFTPDTIERMVRHFGMLLHGVAAQPEAPVWQLPLLDPVERRRVLAEWNQTEAPIPDGCVHELIAAQAARDPDALAVADATTRLTRGELDHRANAVATALRRAGVGLEDRVAVCLPASANMVAVLLGIWKAGAAYLPIDPAYPSERVQFMAQDCDVRLVVRPEMLAALFAEPPAPDLGIAVRPQHLAYVVYTSGSTGSPKGVCIDHRALMNLVAWHQRTYEVTPADRATQFANVAFDAAIWELWPHLAAGASVHIPEAATRASTAALTRWLADTGITLAFLPTPVAEAVAQEPWPAATRLRALLTGGDRLHRGLLPATLPFRLVNHYGPTEYTVVTTAGEVDLSAARDADPPIGRPIANTQVYMLDRWLQPVPVGVPGELVIGGSGLARGYWKDAERTRAAFVEADLGDGATRRLYRTGDLARRRGDGVIEFLGRRDAQVKIRGFRVELGEIEAVLGRQEGVRECVVIAREDVSGDRRLVAYVVGAALPDAAMLRRRLQDVLPDYMVPTAFVPMDALPLTAHGKIDRRALPDPPLSRPALITEYAAPSSALENAIASIWKKMLRIDRVGALDSFFDLGGNSLLSLQMISRLRVELNMDLPVVALFEYPTVRELAARLQSGAAAHPLGEGARRRAATRRPSGGEAPGVAIVGMALRFPGAESAESFWENLCGGVESVTFFKDEELDPHIPAALRSHPDYVKARGVVRDADQFDAPFFGFSPREAEVTDPQQRVFLELAWAALENAAYDPEAWAGLIGVFAGTGINTYYVENVLSRPDLIAAAGSFAVTVGNERDFIATRVAHKLNLKGPAISMQTACSTSLVAVCEAVTSLATHQCDLALAGGVSIATPQNSGHLYQEGSMLSPDGHTRPFDAKGQGTVFNNGAGIVVLKRVEDARRDGDRIYAVIRGVALNNDGAEKMSFAAPSMAGQADVIAMAQANAGVAPESLTYVEAHGTATPVGDPIEIEALTRAFRAGTDRKQFCAIGSVKSNVGHLVAAAGVAGLIKTALALHHRVIPPSLHFENPNPKLDLANSPFFVVSRATEWNGNGAPRRAGVSSFGVGGTNAHVILEEEPPPPSPVPARPWQLLLLSARSAAALDAATRNVRAHLAAHADTNLADVAYTLQTGRRAFAHRRAIVCRSVADALQTLDTLPPSAALTRAAPAFAPSVGFMFPGQGTQYAGMGSQLYAQEPAFRAALDACAALLRTENGVDLLGALKAAGPEAARRLSETALAQPTIFSLSYALAKLWQHWGIQPTAMIGHSVGEFVCACLSGVLSLEDALRLVAARGRMMQDLPRGSMLSVRLPAEKVQARLGPDCAIAAINGPALCVASGPTESIERLQAALTAEGVVCKPLPTSHAFHSPMVDPVVAPFTELVRTCRLAPPTIPFVSTVTATWITDAQATDPVYWGRHARQPVRFAEGVRLLWEQPARVLLEVGPGTTATTLARQQVDPAAGRIAVASLGRGGEGAAEWDALLLAVGDLWSAAATMDWGAFHAGVARRRVPLPTYPFEHQRYWIEPGPAAVPAAGDAAEVPATAARPAAAVARAAEAVTGTRRERLLATIRQLLEEVSGLNLGGAPETTTFFAMGLDSLVLTQLAITLQKRFRVSVTFRQLLEALSSPGTLATHLEQHLPPDATGAGDEPPAATAQPAAPAAAGSAQPPSSGPPARKPFGAAVRITLASDKTMTPAQTAGLNAFIAHYTRRTATSKHLTQQNRPHLADPRVASGFRPAVKEMVYALVVKRSSGCRLWDVDGNEYIDLTSGFGSNFFGYQPDFVKEALGRQIEAGYEIGPQHVLTGEVAAAIRDCTGMDRVAFCSTGSEAVLGAIRMARTITGRDRICMFADAYHGVVDEVIVRGSSSRRSLPAAAGIPASHVSNTLILDYGKPASLDVLRTCANDLAAILTEPVQSRHPEVQPREFLRACRQICDQSGAALVMDEVITGFRMHPGGAQRIFGVQGDIATYGKVLGAGLPLGVIAGRKRFMDALDGGHWSYGDDSMPTVGVTYFAGTFVRHPLALAAAKAALEFLKAAGPRLQRELNDRTDGLVAQLNAAMQRARAPYRVVSFGSMFRIMYPDGTPNADLLFFWLRSKGIHIWDARACFLTLAHTDADLAAVVAAFESSLAELQAAGFLGGDAPAVPAPPAAAALAAGEIEVAVPVTESQREIWASVQMGDDANCAYNESVSVTWRGSLDITAMGEALEATIRRHEALRATFTPDGAAMCIARECDIEIPVLDLSALEASARDAGLQELLRSHVESPFDLVRGPLVRATLVRLEESRHTLVLTTHHIICDGWAIDVVVRDLASLYAGRLHGITFFLGEPDRFSRYAQWLAEGLHTPEMEAQEAYWLRLYADGGPVLDFPTTRPRPAMRTFEAARLDVPMPASLLASARRVAAQCDCSFVTVVLGAFSLLLHRLSGQDDVAVGLPAAGQSLAGAQELVGHCVNLLPLRSRVDWDETFAQYVRRLRTVMLDAYEHQSVTFGSLVRRLTLKRDPSRIPLVPIVFNIDQGINLSGMKFEGLETDFQANPRAFENFELFLNLAPTNDGFVFECTYNTHLFDADTMARRMAGLLAMLDAAAQNPEHRVDRLPVMEAKERARAVQAWNATALAYDRETALPALFERQVAATPNAEALVAGATRWTYATLNGQANRIAHRLRALGVGPDVLVAVCLERQAALPAALLGVLKAGGAYVALDPAYPRERLGYMLTDSNAALVVTTLDLAERVTAPGVRVLALDDATARLEREPDTNPGMVVSPNHLAYVLYTSGSTGKPKGVAIEHHGPMALLAWARTVYTAEELVGVLASTSVCFDLSVFELFVPLTRGGRVILADNAMALAGLPAAREVTLVNTVPSAMTQLLHERALPESVRTVNLAGEVLTQALVKQLYALAHIRNVYDLYGPTEDTTYSTWVRRLADGPETIGRPLANTGAYLLDARQQPVPVGVPGELYLGGEGLARGYLHRPELTAERFLPNPVEGAAHPRLYRTGDRACYLPDGNLVFLGRLDRQAKLRGFRIEPGEIEAALQTHADVAHAAVLVREEQPGDLVLAAYLVPREGHAGALPTATELRKFLRGWLPDFMIPQFFVELAALPLTPNGKIDRQALPPPRRAEASREAVEPRSANERRVAAVWRDVLKVERVGVRDNFFDLGGHSLLAIQAVARLHQETGTRLSPRVLMFNTIEQIAPMLGGG